MLTKEQINKRLLEIAKADEFSGLSKLREVREEIYNMYLSAIDMEIARIENQPAVLRDSLKADFLAHVAEGGDEKISDYITFKRTKVFEYDKKHALQFVIDNGLPYTRVKTELDATPFKRACQDGTVNYPDGETVNAPSVSISKLGDLLILAESKPTE